MRRIGGEGSLCRPRRFLGASRDGWASADIRVTAVTNVNPGNRDPRNGRFGGVRKLFGRDKGDDLLQDRDDLADDPAQEDLAQEDLAEDNPVKRAPAQEHAADRYETAGDGSFDEALDKYYDSRDQAGPIHDEPVQDEPEVREAAPRGKHRRRDEAESDGYGYSHGYTAAATEGVVPNAEFEYGDYIDGENNYGYTSNGSERYDDRDERDDRAVAAAGAGAAGAAGAGAGTGSSTAAAAGGAPKRGLAMILIAVALLLALWGVYAMTKGGSDDQAANDPASQSAQDPNAQNSQAQQSQQNQTQADSNNPNAQQGQEQGQQSQQNQNPNDPNAQNLQPGEGGTQGNSAASAGANNPMTAENQTVNIYNNSAMQDFANRVAAQANEKGMKVGEVGNIPGETAIFEQNTVLYDPATPGAEDRARELADKVGGIALANDDRIPAEAKKPGSLTLVLAENREVVL